MTHDKWTQVEEVAYEHIVAVFRDEETDEVLVAERQDHPWLESPEYHVRKTPEQKSSKVLETLAEGVGVESAEAAVEEITGREISLGESGG